MKGYLFYILKEKNSDLHLFKNLIGIRNILIQIRNKVVTQTFHRFLVETVERLSEDIRSVDGGLHQVNHLYSTSSVNRAGHATFFQQSDNVLELPNVKAWVSK